MNFLREYCKLLEKTEVPPRFSVWTGIACLLAMLERRVFIPQGVYNVYPNYFFILIAASGQKKSTPINLADKLIRRVENGPTVVAQKISPEALIKSIKQTQHADSANILQERCGGIVIADELATFLDRGALDHGLGPILTKLFDCSTFEYQTIKHGLETVKGGYLSLLGGTTVELLRNCLPKDAIGGGFTSRTVFIYEDKVAPPVPWVTYDESLMELEETLVQHLADLTKLSGAISLSAEAREFFDTDYKERYYTHDFRRNGALQGYENRRHSHLLKIAMAFMVSESNPKLVLEAGHIKAAKYVLEEAEEHMPHVMELIIASEVGAQGNQLYQYIRTRGKEGIGRSELVRHFGSRMDSKEISAIMNTLMTGNRIKADTDRNGKLVYVAN